MRSLRYPAGALLALVVPMLLPGRGWAQSRPDVAGVNGAVVAGHPLAAAAGVEVLRRGGNAMDAAITMAAVLAVVRPHMNGVGGDAFLIYRNARSGHVYALNGSGRAGALATPTLFRDRGLDHVPSTGLLSVTVPGAVRAWSDALRRFGTISLDSALAPAIRYAENGFPVSTTLAHDIAANQQKIAADPALAAVFLVDGQPPAVGSLLRQLDLAHTLRAIAMEGADAVYVGSVGRRLAEFMEAEGGLIRIEDLARHSSTWQEPISTMYQGDRVLALPPNSQGVALLMQLNVAQQFQLRPLGPRSAGYVHTLAETTRLVFADRDRYVADPAFFEVPLDRLLSREHTAQLVEQLRERARVGGRSSASPGRAAGDGEGDTVYLCVVDGEGNAVSMMQSLYSAFGSGRMVPGTGIILQNRGSLFSLDPASPNVIAPEKRPYHTLSPAMVLHEDGSLAMVLGTPGGDGQTQTLVQVLNDILLFGMTPQQAVEAPRWRVMPDGSLLMEPGFANTELNTLRSWGDDVKILTGRSSQLGGAQIILVEPRTGVRLTGADPRREAYGIAW